MAGAIKAFWVHGFDGASLGDLESATGVDRSTIYNSFGGKDGLYRSATAAYIDLAEDQMFGPLHQGIRGLADIIEFLDRLANAVESGATPPGCLIVNDMAADVDHEATNRYLECLSGGLHAALERASASGEIDPTKNEQRCQTLVAAILGVNIAHRNAADAALATDMIDGVRAEVESWSVKRPNSD